MQLRRLEREYQEVLKHEIKIKDANKFEGLRNILFEHEEIKTAYQLEEDCLEPQYAQVDDGFGDFQAYAEIQSDDDSQDAVSEEDTVQHT